MLVIALCLNGIDSPGKKQNKKNAGAPAGRRKDFSSFLVHAIRPSVRLAHLGAKVSLMTARAEKEKKKATEDVLCLGFVNRLKRRWEARLCPCVWRQRGADANRKPGARLHLDERAELPVPERLQKLLLFPSLVKYIYPSVYQCYSFHLFGYNAKWRARNFLSLWRTEGELFCVLLFSKWPAVFHVRMGEKRFGQKSWRNEQ